MFKLRSGSTNVDGLSFHRDGLCNKRKAKLIEPMDSNPAAFAPEQPSPRTYLQEESLSKAHFVDETLINIITLQAYRLRMSSKVADSKRPQGPFKT